MLNKASQKRINNAVKGSQIFRDTEKKEETKPRSVLPVGRRRGRYFAPDWMY